VTTSHATGQVSLGCLLPRRSMVQEGVLFSETCMYCMLWPTCMLSVRRACTHVGSMGGRICGSIEVNTPLGHGALSPQLHTVVVHGVALHRPAWNRSPR